MKRWAPAALSAGVVFAIGLSYAAGGHDFCLDDAWIHLDYARSLKLGEGFSYNPFDWETGSSSPLWVGLLAIWPWGHDPVLAVKALCLLFHAASAALGAELVWTVARLDARADLATSSAAPAALASGLLVALEPSLLQSATSGMEVSLTSALLLFCLWLELRGRTAAACAIALLATLARVEALFFVGAFAGLRLVSERRARALYVALAGAAGLLLWMGYCYAVSGLPWPNTKYAKHVGFDPDGLLYLGVQVLLLAPWLVGLGGIPLLVMAISRAQGARRAAAIALCGAWFAAVIAIAVSRPFTPGVLFYASRYFAIVAAIPCVATALGLPYVKRGLALACLVPIAGANAFLVIHTLSLQRAQESDIALTASQPARFAATTLPKDAVIIAENAGATRFFAPRSMRILDMLGLNMRTVVHAQNDQERLCIMLAAHPTHLLVPDEFLSITAPLAVEPLRTFTDPEYSISWHRYRRSVHLFALAGLKPRWRRLCAR